MVFFKKRDFIGDNLTLMQLEKFFLIKKKGTEVIYITGNHDDFLRNYTPLFFDKYWLLKQKQFFCYN